MKEVTSDRNIVDLLGRIADSLQHLAMAMTPASEISKPILEYPSFDWSSIGAKVLRTDEDGVSVVEWNGQVYKRRSPDNQFGACIWFSRCVGKSENGNNKYETLISFEEIKDDVQPLGKKARQLLQSAPRSARRRESPPVSPQHPPRAEQTRIAPADIEQESSETAQDLAAAAAAQEEAHRAIEHQLRKIYLESGRSLSEWEAYYNQKNLADLSLNDKKQRLELWQQARADQKSGKVTQLKQRGAA